MKIKSLEHLKKVAGHQGDGSSDRASFFIPLNGGFRSSKEIGYYKFDDSWEIFNHISGAWEDYDSTEEFIECEPFIIEAINEGALIHEEN